SDVIPHTHSRQLATKMLHTDPDKRITVAQLKRSSYMLMNLAHDTQAKAESVERMETRLTKTKTATPSARRSIVRKSVSSPSLAQAWRESELLQDVLCDPQQTAKHATSSTRTRLSTWRRSIFRRQTRSNASRSPSARHRLGNNGSPAGETAPNGPEPDQTSQR